MTDEEELGMTGLSFAEASVGKGVGVSETGRVVVGFSSILNLPSLTWLRLMRAPYQCFITKYCSQSLCYHPEEIAALRSQ